MWRGRSPLFRLAAAAILLACCGSAVLWRENNGAPPGNAPILKESPALPAGTAPEAAEPARGPAWARLPEISRVDTPHTDRDGWISRVRLLRGPARFPLIRSEEEIRPDGSAASGRAIAADHVSVVLRDGRSEAELRELFAPMGGTVTRRLPLSGQRIIHFPDAGADTVSRALALVDTPRGRDALRTAEADWIVSASRAPDDSRFSEQWGMNNTAQTGGRADADIDAPEAWDYGTGNRSVTVAVIDTGVDHTHPDLASNMWTNSAEANGLPGVDDDGNGYVDDIRGWDWVNDDNDPADDNRHGTHCAGTIGATGNDGAGVAGVCWEVSIMPLKFLSSGGSGLTSDAAEAVAYAARMGAAVSSNSWGGGGYSQSLRDAIAKAAAANSLFVCAAGNDGLNADATGDYPGGFDIPSIINTAATDASDQLAGFSNFGPSSVDLAAPGVLILSTAPSGGYALMNGTSMATPFVSGAAALLKSVRPALTPGDLKRLLLDSTDRLPSLAGKCVSGGRLNLHEAMSRLTDVLVTPGEGMVTTGRQGGPFRPDSMEWTVVNNGAGPAAWTASADAPWVSVDPSSGVIGPGESVRVRAALTPASGALNAGTRVAEITFTNSATGRSQSRPVELVVERPAELPFREDFEGVFPQPWWTVRGAGNFRTRVMESNGPHSGKRHLIMDEALDSGFYARNELTLTLDTSGFENPRLTFFAKGFDEDPDGPPPSPHTGSVDYDGVSLSVDGVSWHEVAGLRNPTDSWRQYSVDLGAEMSRLGLPAEGIVRLRFVQYDNYSIVTDGIALDDVEITGVPARRLEWKMTGAPLAENGSAVAAELTLSRAPSSPLTVRLRSSLPDSLSAPAEVTVPTGALSVSFPLTPVNDTAANGTRSVTLTATATGYQTAVATREIDDDETAVLALSLPDTVTEGVESAGEVSLPFAAAADLSVPLASGDPGRLAVPAAAVIPAGARSARFSLSPAQNQLVERPVEVKVTTAVRGWPAAEARTRIQDDESRALTVTLPASARETDGMPAAEGRVSAAGPLTEDLTVTLTSGSPGRLTAPARVTIPATKSSAAFSLTLIDNALKDGVERVAVTASAAGFTNGEAVLDVYDDESRPAARNPSPPHLAADAEPGLTLAWSLDGNLPGIRFEVFFGTDPEPGAADLLGSTTTLTWTPLRLEPGRAYFWRVDAVYPEGVSPGPVWSFTVPPPGDVAAFTFDAIPSPRSVNVPFPVTITARDSHGSPARSFRGAAGLSTGSGPAPSMLLTEVNANSPDSVELTNVSGAPLDVSGWTVAFYDEYNYVTPVTIFTFPPGTVTAVNGVLTIGEGGTAPGAAPGFLLGKNLYWTTDPSSRVAALLRDAEGRIVDFMCASSFNPSAIAEPRPVPAEQWDGPSKTAPDDNLRAYVRTGGRDGNTGADWGYALPGIGKLNPGLETPFITAVSFGPDRTGTFVDGVWTGEVTMRSPGAVVKLIADDGDGHTGVSPAFQVESLGALTLSHPATLGEGSAPAVLRVALPIPLASPAVVEVRSSLPGALRVTPSTVAVPAGGREAAFTLEAPENTDLDLTRTVVLTATAPGFTTTESTVTVTDNESGTLDLSLPPAVSEGELQAPAMAVVSVTPAPSSALRITVASGDPSELTVPAEVMIPAGQTGAAFFLTPVDDAILDGPRTVSVTVSRDGWPPVTRFLRVEDNESRALSLTAPDPVVEGASGHSARIAVAGLLRDPLTVRLYSSRQEIVRVPETAVIPAGQSSVSFPLTLAEDSLPNLPRRITLSAEADGFSRTAKEISLLDNDPAGFRFDTLPTDIATGAPVIVTVTALDPSGAVLTGYSGAPALSASTLTGPAEVRLEAPAVLVAGVWTGKAWFFTSTEAMRLRVQEGGVSGDSAVFSVQPGPEIALSVPAPLEQPQDSLRVRPVVLTNTGGRPLTWTASFPPVSAGGLSRTSPHALSALSGHLAAGESATLSLTTDTLDFPAGDWATALRIVSDSVARPVLETALPLKITPGESVFRVTPPADLQFTEVRGQTSGPRSAGVANTGSRPLPWTASVNQQWLEVSPVSGTLAPGSPVAVEVRARTGALVPGAYKGAVVFRSEDRFSAPVTAEFSLTVLPRAERFEWSPLPVAAAAGESIPVTITARLADQSPAEYFTDSVALSLSPAGPGVSPAVAGPFTAGVWKGSVRVGEAAAAVRFRALHAASGAEGFSGSIDLLSSPPVMLAEPPVSGGSGNTLAWLPPPGGAGDYQAQWANAPDFPGAAESPWVETTTHRFEPLPEGALYFRVRGRLLNEAQWTRAGGPALNEGVTENLIVEHERLVLAPGPPLAENFNASGGFKSTVFGGPGVNGYQLTASPAGPLIPVGNPPLPINTGGDAECRGLGDALTPEGPGRIFRDGQIDGYLTRTSPVPVSAGFWMRASPSAGSITGVCAAVRWLSATTARVEVRKSVNGVVTTLGSPGADFAVSRFPVENLRLRVEARGQEISVFLWKVAVTGGVVTETPLPIDTDGSAIIRRADPNPAEGRPGLSGQGLSGAMAVFDDVTAAPWSGARPGVAVSPVISFPDLARWGALRWEGHRDSVRVDVLNAAGEELAVDTDAFLNLDDIPAVAAAPAIRLRARFSPINGLPPELRSWSVAAFTSRADQRTLWSAPVSSLQDNTPPELIVTTPVAHESGLPPAVTGSVRDAAGLKSFTANGVPVFPSANGEWSIPASALPITLAAADNAEPPNRSSAVWQAIILPTDGPAAERALLTGAFPAGPPAALLTPEGALLLRFTRPILHTGLNYTVELSADLRSWIPLENPPVTAAVRGRNGLTEEITWRVIGDTRSSALRYARLRVTR